MALEGFSCPPGSPTYGERHEIAYCLGECAAPCVSGPLLKSIYEADRANYHQGTYLSASLLAGAGCARKTILERQYPFYEYPVNRWYSFRGTLAHSLIEGTSGLEQYGWLQELRMKVPLVYPGEPSPIFDEGKFTGEFDETQPLVLTLSGTTDAFNVLRGELHDFKSMADIKAVEMATGQHLWGGDEYTMSRNIPDKFVWQTNIYRWLIAHTPIPDDMREAFDLQGEFFRAPDVLVIQGFSMMYLPRTGSGVEVKVPKGRRSVRETFEVEAVPVLPLEEVEAYIRPRALKWYRYLTLNEYPPVADEQTKWLCKFCAFNGEQIEGERCFPERERYEQAKEAA